MKTLEIGGETYTLRMTVNAACEIEERANKPFSALLGREFTTARWMLWGALRAGHPKMTVAQAGELIDAHLAAGGKLQEITSACLEAIKEAGFFGRAAETTAEA